jgi:GNAT superfamily N-acetyltransferase
VPAGYLVALDVATVAGRWLRTVTVGAPRVFVAMVSDAVAGWICFGPSRDDDVETHCAEVEAIYVAPAFWKRGIGTALMSAALESLHAEGYSAVTLWVLKDNQSAQSFYVQRGLQADGSARVIKIGGAALTEVRFKGRIGEMNGMKSEGQAMRDTSASPPMARLIHPLTDLPSQIVDLEREASEEGFHFLGRLVAEWRTGSNRFDKPGECLLAVTENGILVGIGGLNADPYRPDGATARLRRLYVAKAFRRRGVGEALVLALLQKASPWFRSVRLSTDTESASAFYCRLGFIAVDDETATHSKTL